MKSKSSGAPQLNPPANGQAGEFRMGALFISVVGIAVAIGCAMSLRGEDSATAGADKIAAPVKFVAPASYEELCALPLAEVAKCDIALLNLLCSEGLKGSETPTIPECLATIDKWAAHIKSEIERNLHRYHESPEKFRSVAYFRMAMLVTVLKQDLKVHYDEARSTDEMAQTFFADSSSSFIRGMLGPRCAGTCASIPVLIVAIGQRLDYPVKLVAARAHFFVRWDDGKERFNVEATNGGMTTHPDEYYLSWPKPITEEMMKAEGFLTALTPVQALGCFLQTRSICLLVNGRKADVKQACLKGLECLPSSKMFNFKL